MTRLRDGEAPRIFGDARQTRDYVFAGDVAEATLAALDADGGVFNIGTGRETSVLELLERIEHVAGREGPSNRTGLAAPGSSQEQRGSRRIRLGRWKTAAGAQRRSR